ncbi:hypothetical protein VPH35_003727 [Triticum aestivum]
MFCPGHGRLPVHPPATETSSARCSRGQSPFVASPPLPAPGTGRRAAPASGSGRRASHPPAPPSLDPNHPTSSGATSTNVAAVASPWDPQAFPPTSAPRLPVGSRCC